MPWEQASAPTTVAALVTRVWQWAGAVVAAHLVRGLQGPVPGRHRLSAGGGGRTLQVGQAAVCANYAA